MKLSGECTTAVAVYVPRRGEMPPWRDLLTTILSPLEGEIRVRGSTTFRMRKERSETGIPEQQVSSHYVIN